MMDCQLQVWHAATQLEQRGDFETRCESLLPDEERVAADRFRRTTTRNQHVVGRAMARRLLGDLAVAPQTIQFEIGQHGKPIVAFPPEAKQPFNVAHTDGLVLCGIASDAVDLVGVDVEGLNRRTSTELAERYFSPPEVKFLRSKPIDQQKFFFLRIWTLKEAFIKAIGTGLHTPLCDFAFSEIDSNHPQIDFLDPGLDDGRCWSFICSQPRPGFVASTAVATKSRPQAMQVDWRPFETLLDETPTP